jgi:predicted pyridoxine 5'-phosphate oxidase superfamily flavin-nucleotide-binding protein
MGKTHAAIDTDLVAWLERQPVFFVATAPLSAEGHVNCSPKGGNSLRVLGPREVAYADGSGSGVETVAHLRENGRLVLMFCAFEGAPKIVRLHGRGTVLVPGEPQFHALFDRFPPQLTVRSIVRLQVQRIADSCGYNVPKMDFRETRRDGAAWLAKSSDAALRKYLVGNNQRSLDGLPAMQPEELERVVIRRDTP